MKSKILLLFFALLAVVMEMRAQATLSMQGTIRNSTGSAVSDGIYSLTFRLYTAESGGAPVWTETQDNIKVTGGVYSALLGATNPLSAAFNVPYFVGISVDGGSELLPRFRLTSAPYALALIGQSNTFPSSGPVGVGTSSPQSGVELHVSDNSGGDASILLSTADDKTPMIQLKKGTTLADVDVSGGFLNVDGNTMHTRLLGNGQERLKTTDSGVTVPGDLTVGGDLALSSPLNINEIRTTSIRSVSSTSPLDLYRGNDVHISCKSNMTQLYNYVYISGFQSQSLSNAHYKFEGLTNNWVVENAGQTRDIGLVVDKNIRTSGIRIYSDARIKRDIHQSNSLNDLSTLMKLRVTDYKYIDSVKSGVGPNKGFIAQEVEKVYPLAVKTITDAVPGIYTSSLKCDINGDEATFTLDKAHALQAGDRVRIYLSKDQETFDVVRVDGDMTFTVKGWNEKGEPAGEYPFFVYGKEVRDFKEVDYDRIHNLNVSATQELARQVEQLRTENAELRSKYENILRANETVNGRLAKLEALLNSSDSRR